jgi:ABC-type multidrug transport system fused ATPase/permease subunit
MTSVERILEYTNETSEPLHKEKRKPPSIDWPRNGEIEYKNVSLRYEATLPCFLRNLSFKIEGGEKIGIVGRTGAGKSSLLQTLFRLYEPDGSILIDGVDIKELSLIELRKIFTLIPVYFKSLLKFMIILTQINCIY